MIRPGPSPRFVERVILTCAVVAAILCLMRVHSLPPRALDDLVYLGLTIYWLWVAQALWRGRPVPWLGIRPKTAGPWVGTTVPLRMAPTKEADRGNCPTCLQAPDVISLGQWSFAVCRNCGVRWFLGALAVGEPDQRHDTANRVLIEGSKPVKPAAVVEVPRG